jgi:hypothetical protein
MQVCGEAPRAVADPVPFQERGTGGKDSGSGEVAAAAYDLDFDLTGIELINAFAKKFCEILELFGANPVVRLSARANLMRLCANEDESVVCSKAKKFCESFSARLFETDHEPVECDGSFGRWISARLWETPGKRGYKKIFGPPRNACELSESLAKAKGCLGYASDWMVTTAKRAHQKKVIESVPDSEFTFLAKEAIGPVIDYIVERVSWEGARVETPAKSTGSTQSKRKVGGKGGGLYRFWHGVRETNPMDVPDEWDRRIRAGPTELPISRTEGRPGHARFCHLGPDERPDEACLWEDPVVSTTDVWTSDGTTKVEVDLDYPQSKEQWHEFVLQEARGDIVNGESGWVQVTAISEAGGKVRIVTAGSQAGATFCTMWQERILAVMRTLPCFPSMSRTITADLVNQVMGQARVLAASSDFTAATDLLNPGLTNWILARLVEGLRGADVVMDDNADKEVHYGAMPREYKVAQENGVTIRGRHYALAAENQKGIVLKYGGRLWMVKREFPTAQKECGQLMGQLTSFILLCLSNAACTLAAFGLHGISHEEAMGRFIINGDDRLARSSIAIEDTFWQISSSIGLKRSPGKSHEDLDFACINSQMYWRSPGGLWRRIQVLRSTLFFGIMKLPTDAFKPSHIVTALFDHVPAKAMEKAKLHFLDRWKGQIDAECQGRNLFLPVALNGMGQTAPPGWEWFVTPKQAFVADHLMRTQPYLSWAAGPQWPGPPRDTPKTKIPWDLPTASWDAGTLEEELAQFKKRYGLRILEALFKRRRAAFCCGSERKGDCECGAWYGDCPESRPRITQAVCSCLSVEEQAWLRIGVETAPLPCQHKRKVAVRWECPCHGRSMEWRVVDKPVAPVDYDLIRSAVRPTLTYMAAPDRAGHLRFTKRAVTWGSDPAKWMSVKSVPISPWVEFEAGIRKGIDIAVAEATGDWRGLIGDGRDRLPDWSTWG